MSAELVETSTELVTLRMTHTVIGTGLAGQELSFPPDEAARLVSMGVARFIDPELWEAWRHASAAVEPQGPTFDEQQMQEAGNGTRARIRESRPRGRAQGRDGGSGTPSPADNTNDAEQGEGLIAG